MANKVHVVKMSKGGVGKTTVATKLAQYLAEKGAPPLCIDTDPSNRVFFGFKGLSPHYVNVSALTKKGTRELHEELHDEVIELIAKTEPERDVVIDTGASNFVQFNTWMLGTEVPDAIRDLGRELLLHTVISGGNSQLECLHCLGDLLEHYEPPTRFVVWLNPFDGDLTVRGRAFEDMPIYQRNKRRISAIVTMPEWDRRTRALMEQILEENLTFAEALERPDMPILDRRRLRIAKDDAFAPIEATGLFG